VVGAAVVGAAVVGAAVVGAAVVGGADHQVLNKLALATAGAIVFMGVEFHSIPSGLVPIKPAFVLFTAVTYHEEPFHATPPMKQLSKGAVCIVHVIPSELVATTPFPFTLPVAHH
jgi:hypothetical protein